MQPVLRQGSATVYERHDGKVILEEGGKKTEFRNAEECWPEIKKRRAGQ